MGVFSSFTIITASGIWREEEEFPPHNMGALYPLRHFSHVVASEKQQKSLKNLTAWLRARPSEPTWPDPGIFLPLAYPFSLCWRTRCASYQQSEKVKWVGLVSWFGFFMLLSPYRRIDVWFFPETGNIRPYIPFQYWKSFFACTSF